MYKFVLCPYVKVPLQRHPQDSHPTLGASWQYISVTHKAALSLYSVCSSRMNTISVLFQCHSINYCLFQMKPSTELTRDGGSLAGIAAAAGVSLVKRGHLPHASFQCLLLSSSFTDFHWLASFRIWTVYRQVNGIQIPAPPTQNGLVGWEFLRSFD